MATLSRCSAHPLGIARVSSSNCIAFGCRHSAFEDGLDDVRREQRQPSQPV
jgi:hypothetical protein